MQLKYKRRIIRAVAGVSGTALVLTAAFCLPADTWWNLGRQAALLSAALLQPQSSIQALTEDWERSMAAAGKEESGSGEDVTPPGDVSVNEQQPPESSEVVIPPKGDGGGAIVEEQVGGGNEIAPGVYAKNPGGKEIDAVAYLEQDIGIRFEDTAEPQVLIYHTHTTENYMTYYAGYYNDEDVTRDLEGTRSVLMAGNALAARLEAAGIGVVHATDVHDYPQYTGGYTRSEVTIQRELAAHPSIKVVLDLHRDALLRDDTTKVKATATVNGEKAAQMMIIACTADTEDQPDPYWEENTRFGLHLQQYLSETYPGLMRPMSLTDVRYNQHLHSGALLIEIGTDANTVSEAMYSANLLGDALVTLLKG